MGRRRSDRLGDCRYRNGPCAGSDPAFQGSNALRPACTREHWNAAELEFLAASGEENLEDRMVLLTERGGGAPAEHEISLRLLRHYASSVYHQQYHDTDIVTVRVEGDAKE